MTSSTNFNSATNEFFFKVVLIGAPCVGKTSILERFVTNTFSDDYKATIGADFRTKDVIFNGQTVLLQIWDTAGQERFRALAAPFYRGANICVLVFDVNERLTFEAVDQWRDEFLHHADVSQHHSFPFLLLGNKSDLGVKVTKSEVHQWLQQRGYKNMVYLETSAMNDVNIEESFDQVAKLCLSHPSNQSLYKPNLANAMYHQQGISQANQGQGQQGAQDNDRVNIESVFSDTETNKTTDDVDYGKSCYCNLL